MNALGLPGRWELGGECTWSPQNDCAEARRLRSHETTANLQPEGVNVGSLDITTGEINVGSCFKNKLEICATGIDSANQGDHIVQNPAVTSGLRLLHKQHDGASFYAGNERPCNNNRACLASRAC